jgi:hypothetical protein
LDKQAEGTTVELEGCIAAGDVQTLISRTTPHAGASANSANRVPSLQQQACLLLRKYHLGIGVVTIAYVNRLNKPPVNTTSVSIILFVRPTQASAPRSILWLSLKGQTQRSSPLQAPYLPWAKIKGTYYHWDTTAGPNIKGNILGNLRGT